MTPVNTNPVSRLDVNDLAGGRSTRIASNVTIIDVRDGVVGRRNADTIALTKILSVNPDALSNCMC